MAAMGTWVALLRGVNVGGARKLPMAELRTIVASAGARDVTTYIQSGNVVFTHPGRAAATLEGGLERRIEDATGLDVTVMLRSPAQLAKVVRANPYPKAEATKLVVLFLKGRADPGTLRTVDPGAFAPESFVVAGPEVYLHLPHGQGRAKLPVALGRVLPPSTARNWQTVTKLLELSSA